ncbi:MAG: hypothetical protein JWL59_2514 [Chthoniobacteraceae bacterium]|nr:hypothetical protein [Chthoniobacteraceae bacterium]
MKTSHSLDFGAVYFMPVEYLSGSIHTPNQKADIDRGRAARLLETPCNVDNLGDWPRVHTAFRKGGVFVVEASTPNLHATLRFFPERPHTGDYEIHNRLNHRVERGRTITVRPVPLSEPDQIISILAPFPTRYAVVTASSDCPPRRLMWLVGLKAFRSLNETDELNNDPLHPQLRLDQRLFGLRKNPWQPM